VRLLKICGFQRFTAGKAAHFEKHEVSTALTRRSFPAEESSGIIFSMWIICPQCGSRFQNIPGDLRQYSCSNCGNRNLLRVRTEQERSRDALAGLAAGAAVGAAVGELPGALVGGVVGLLLGLLRTPTVEQTQE
jgi:DNA-directed RNA polymerase subunit RPC12/RpoP